MSLSAKEEYTLVNFGTRTNLKTIVDKLVFMNDLGAPTYTKHKGVKLYSDSVSYESAKRMLEQSKEDKRKDDYIVYVTDNGSKYHTEDCDSILINLSGTMVKKKDARFLTRKIAERKGYKPCTLCEME